MDFFKTNRELVVFITLAVLVLAIYWQTTGFDFINLDDNLYVYDNSAVMSGLNWPSVKWAFTAFHSANWHPLTWLSHMLDVEIFGSNASGYHVMNIVLHLINSCLAFAVFRKMTGCFLKSAVVAALFAVHPAHVESVAWVAERKDVLSTLFWLLTMFAYLRYAEVSSPKSQVPSPQNSSDNEDEKPVKEDEGSVEKNGDKKSGTWDLGPGTKFYVLTLVLFALGLMAKPMLVTLPFVLLLMDFWALGRLKKLKDLPALLLEKLPFFVLTAASSYITILAQRTVNAVESLDSLPFGTRLLNALLAYAKYIGKLFYPSDLAVWYPYERNFPAWQIAVAAALMVGVTAFCVWQIRARKYLLMGWLWFLGTLVPVIGIMQVGGQSLADRYTYVPFFGLFIMLVWGADDLFKKFKLNKTAFAALFAVATIIFAFVSFNQTKFWRNSETLYRHTLAVTQNNYLISHNLCHYLMNANRLDEAEPFCRSSIEMNPLYANAYNTLGIIQFKRGQTGEAEKSFLQALQIAPDSALSYANLSVAQSILIKPEEAEANLQKAMLLGGNSVEPQLWINALNDVAFAYNAKGNYEKAAEYLTKLLAINPNDAAARGNLALTLSKMKRFDEAHKLIDPIVQTAPNDPNVYNTYGLILLEENRNTEAAAQFEKALQLKPDFEEAKTNLKKAKGEK